jgi:hypothetical protein
MLDLSKLNNRKVICIEMLYYISRKIYYVVLILLRYEKFNF